MPLAIFRRGTVWHYRGTVAGRRLRGSTGATDKKIAQRIAAEREAREWKCRLDGPASVLTFAQAATLYLDAQRSHRYLGFVAAYWKDTPVADITAGAVRQAAIVLCPTHAGSTRNRSVIVPTQAVINHAAEMELCQPLRVRRFPVEKREKEPATWAWVQAFMAAARPNLAALACFMFLTGARIGEAVRVTWNDLDLAGTSVLIRQTKIGAERRAHLPPVLVAAIANIRGAPNVYLRRPVNDRVFGYLSSKTAQPMWNRAIERAGIKHLGPHACRHGFATALLHAGIDPVTIAKVGGWRSVQHVVSTYGHAMEDRTITDRIVGEIGTKLTRSTKATG